MQSEHKFLSRPSTTLENDELIKGGITFNVKYIGCIEVYASMKILDFTCRSNVAKECIHRVCDAIKGKTPKKRQVEKTVKQCISNVPCMEFAGSNVSLNISSRCLEIKSQDTNDVVARHDMPRISFASVGGDSESMDYVAYVAKDVTDWRACYVLECGNAQTLISVLGQAFELRYKEYYGALSNDNKYMLEGLKHKESKESCEQDYYNDLPGKTPPELSNNNKATYKSPINEKPRERISSNLIDLDTQIEHAYVNESTSFEEDKKNVTETSTSKSSKSPEAKLHLEKWFHGSISRIHSESLLKNDGDFLVRESQNTRGQFVLTGMKSSQAKHLLLIDPDGCVRTKDRVFDNIPHLINYHWTNCIPIISSESALLLQMPVLRATDVMISNVSK